MRWAWIPALAAVVACSGGAPSSPTPPTPPTSVACVRATCEQLGKNCGQVADGCGAFIDCGGCPSGENCGGDEVANVCGHGPCEPLTCAAAGAQCGQIATGCGDVIDCGSCPGGAACGSAGVPNVCGHGACQPLTCASAHAECGSVSDGCGGSLDCGTCPAGQTCGSAASPNTCVADALGATNRWARSYDGPGQDALLATTTDASGNVYLLARDSELAGPHPLVVRKLDASGTEQVRWVFADAPAQNGFIAVSPLGNVFVFVTLFCNGSDCSGDFGAGRISGAVVVKLTPAGKVEWQRASFDLAVGLAVDSHGSAIVLSSQFATSSFNHLTKFAFDGGELFSGGAWADAVAVDATDEILLGGMAPKSEPIIVGQTGSQLSGDQAPYLAKLDPGGQFLWARELTGAQGRLTALSTAGTQIVGVGSFSGTGTYGGVTLSSSSSTALMLTAALDGTPKLARILEALGPADTVRLGLDPGGKLLVTAHDQAAAYDLLGNALWTRQLPGLANTAAGASGNLLVGGAWDGAKEFGDGVRTANNGGAYLLELVE
jgi:hypothetical protein